MSETAAHALLKGLIDYAGLFPPAELELEPAFDNFSGYRPSPFSWMLARFVCPTHRIEELSHLVAQAPESHLSYDASVTLPPTENLDELLEKLSMGVAIIVEAGKVSNGRLRAGSIEARLPTTIIGQTEGALYDELLSSTSRALERGGLKAQVFVEQPLSTPPRPLVLALHRFNEAGHGRNRAPWGLKLRCGGADAEAFPSSYELATAVLACRDEVVPFKATAGLHHPLPTRDDQLGAGMHGFLNLFGGAVIAGVHGIDEEELVEILSDDAPSSFRFCEERLHWRHHVVSVDEIAHFRRVLATSFGSCSYDEPVTDLTDLGVRPSGDSNQC